MSLSNNIDKLKMIKKLIWSRLIINFNKMNNKILMIMNKILEMMILINIMNNKYNKCSSSNNINYNNNVLLVSRH